MESYDDEDEPDEGRGWQAVLPMSTPDLPTPPPSPPLCQEFGLMMMINMLHDDDFQ